MAYPNSILRPGSAFDSFLFASVGEDRNGTPISVLSAMARSDVDPWLEADQLAHLSSAAAGRKLAAIIASLTEAPSVQAQSESIAARLIALLPVNAAKSKVQQEKAPGPPTAEKSANSRFAVIWVLLMAVVFGAQALMSGDQRQALPQVNGPAAAATPIAPPTPAIAPAAVAAAASPIETSAPQK